MDCSLPVGVFDSGKGDYGKASGGAYLIFW